MLKRQTQKNVFRISALFVAAFLCVFGLFVLIKNSFAETSQGISMNSAHASYENHDEGAWTYTQKASAQNTETAKIEMQVKTILKGNGKDKDLFIMMDTSGSMTSARIEALKSAIITMGSALLGDGNNCIQIDAFSNDVQQVINRTCDIDMFRINVGTYMPAAGGGTDYYKAIQRLEERLSDYTPDENREAIILFITDGAPVEDHPMEVPEYQVFKQNYPFVTVQGIQYEMGNDIIPQLAAVSDNQFAANINNVEDMLFEAAMDGEKYSEFVVTDYLNSDYYEVASMTASIGTASVVEDNGQTKIVWDMSNRIRSSQTQKLTVELNIKQACRDREDGLCAVNQKTTISSKLNGVTDENVETTETPVLKFRYNLSYDLNAPDGCDTTGLTPPAASTQLIGTTLQISDYAPTCDDYQFGGWVIATDQAKRVNGDYFVMPEEDTILRALWSKPSISKSMDGTIKEMTTATFRASTSSATYYNETYSNGYQSTFANIAGSLNNIKHIRYSNKMPADASFSDATKFSDDNISELPIYGYFDSSTGTFYFYSDADIIYLNKNSKGMFAQLRNLEDIQGLDNFDASNVENFSSLFNRSGKLNDISGVAHFKTPKLTNLADAFMEADSITNLDAVAGWDVSHVTSMSSAFRAMNNLSDITALADWETSSLTTLGYLFMDSAIQDISGVEDWDVSHVTNMNSMCYNSGITSLAPLAGWQTSSLNSLSETFRGTKITNTTGLEGWDVSRVTSLPNTFESNPNLNSLAGIAGWDVSHVTTMSETFRYDHAITNLSDLSGWDVPALQTLSYTFANMNNLASLQGLEGWETPSLKSLNYAFANNAKLSNITALSGWDTKNLTTLTNTFRSDPLITSIAALSGWDAKKISSMSAAFMGTGITSAVGLDTWQTDSLTNLSETFSGTQLGSLTALSGFDTDSVTTLYHTFYNTKIINASGLDDWDVGLVSNMEGIFSTNSLLESLAGLEDWRPVSVTTLNNAFSYNPKLANVDELLDWRTPVLSNLGGCFRSDGALANIAGMIGWMTGNVTTIENIFDEDGTLASLHGMENWDLQKLTTMSSAFEDTTSLTNVSALQNKNMPALTNMWSAFSRTGLTDLNGLSGINIPKVSGFGWTFRQSSHLTDISAMSTWTIGKINSLGSTFEGCDLTSLNGLQSLDTSALGDLTGAFRSNGHLSDISALASWTDTSHVNSLTYTFSGDRSLTDVSALANWNVESVNQAANTFDGTNVMDFTVLNNWHLPDNVSYYRSMFNGLPSGAVLPSWYNP